MKIVLVESDQRLVKDITFCLQVRYPDVEMSTADNESKAMELTEDKLPDLIFIDSSVKGVDTLSLISSIREFSDAPIIILSESETDMDRARGLEAGADEYVPKPLSPIELLARCKATLRRTRGTRFTPERSISIDGLTFDYSTREVFFGGQQVKLTPIEYALLSELAKNEGRLVAARELLDKVWGSEYLDESYLVKAYIYRLRSKLEQHGFNSQKIINERGFGYRLVGNS